MTSYRPFYGILFVNMFTYKCQEGYYLIQFLGTKITQFVTQIRFDGGSQKPS